MRFVLVTDMGRLSSHTWERERAAISVVVQAPIVFGRVRGRERASGQNSVQKWHFLVVNERPMQRFFHLCKTVILFSISLVRAIEY